MEIYLFISAIYAVYGISKGNRLHIAVCLGLLWPVFLFLGLFGKSITQQTKKYEQRKESNLEKYSGESTIHECRSIVNVSINTLCNVLIEKSEQDSDNLLWSTLLVDISMHKAAIRLFPENTPVLAVAFLKIINLLEQSALRSDLAVKDRKFLSSLLADLSSRTNNIGQKITAIQGKKISDYEVQEAKRLINSVKWDSDKKAFALTA